MFYYSKYDRLQHDRRFYQLQAKDSATILTSRHFNPARILVSSNEPRAMMVYVLIIIIIYMLKQKRSKMTVPQQCADSQEHTSLNHNIEVQRYAVVVIQPDTNIIADYKTVIVQIIYSVKSHPGVKLSDVIASLTEIIDIVFISVLCIEKGPHILYQIVWSKFMSFTGKRHHCQQKYLLHQTLIPNTE